MIPPICEDYFYLPLDLMESWKLLCLLYFLPLIVYPRLRAKRSAKSYLRRFDNSTSTIKERVSIVYVRIHSIWPICRDGAVIVYALFPAVSLPRRKGTYLALKTFHRKVRYHYIVCFTNTTIFPSAGWSST